MQAGRGPATCCAGVDDGPAPARQVGRLEARLRLRERWTRAGAGRGKYHPVKQDRTRWPRAGAGRGHLVRSEAARMLTRLRCGCGAVAVRWPCGVGVEDGPAPARATSSQLLRLATRVRRRANFCVLRRARDVEPTFASCDARASIDQALCATRTFDQALCATRTFDQALCATRTFFSISLDGDSWQRCRSAIAQRKGRG